MSKYKNIDQIIDFITDGDISDLSDLSNDEDEIEEINVNTAEVEMDTETESESLDEDDIPLAEFVTQDQGNPRKRVYLWRKRDIPMIDKTFTGTFDDLKKCHL